jgi:Ankyrin repeat
MHTLLRACNSCRVSTPLLLHNTAFLLVQQLLQAGADPNLGNRAGFTPLMLSNSPDVVNCLLNNGADIEKKTGEALITAFFVCLCICIQVGILAILYAHGWSP